MAGPAALPIPLPPDNLLASVLRERFGLREFRPWQREAIDALLQGSGRVLVVAPTGGGKSLTYQVPAAVLDGVTIVLSPLVALMEDQVRALEARRIPATFFASTLEPETRRQREASMWAGRYKLVYAAPERLASEAFVDAVSRSNVQLVAVDEAHCIAQWGHDFRPDYLRIGALLARLRPPRVLACTATATPEVRRGVSGPSCASVTSAAKFYVDSRGRTFTSRRAASRGLAMLEARSSRRWRRPWARRSRRAAGPSSTRPLARRPNIGPMS